MALLQSAKVLLTSSFFFFWPFSMRNGCKILSLITSSPAMNRILMHELIIVMTELLELI